MHQTVGIVTCSHQVDVGGSETGYLCDTNWTHIVDPCNPDLKLGQTFLHLTYTHHYPNKEGAYSRFVTLMFSGCKIRWVPISRETRISPQLLAHLFFYSLVGWNGFVKFPWQRRSLWERGSYSVYLKLSRYCNVLNVSILSFENFLGNGIRRKCIMSLFYIFLVPI